MYTKERVDVALTKVKRPNWVCQVAALETPDADGEPALEVRVLVRRGLQQVSKAELSNYSTALHNALREADPERWPYIPFIGEDVLRVA